MREALINVSCCYRCLGTISSFVLCNIENDLRIKGDSGKQEVVMDQGFTASEIKQRKRGLLTNID